MYSSNKIIDNPCSCHAEMDVLHKCLKTVKPNKLKKLTFYVIRISSTGSIGCSAPCLDCMTKLSKYNIKKFIYRPPALSYGKTILKSVSRMDLAASILDNIENLDNPNKIGKLDYMYIVDKCKIKKFK